MSHIVCPFMLLSVEQFFGYYLNKAVHIECTNLCTSPCFQLLLWVYVGHIRFFWICISNLCLIQAFHQLFLLKKLCWHIHINNSPNVPIFISCPTHSTTFFGLIAILMIAEPSIDLHFLMIQMFATTFFIGQHHFILQRRSVPILAFRKKADELPGSVRRTNHSSLLSSSGFFALKSASWSLPVPLGTQNSWSLWLVLIYTVHWK